MLQPCRTISYMWCLEETPLGLLEITLALKVPLGHPSTMSSLESLPSPSYAHHTLECVYLQACVSHWTRSFLRFSTTSYSVLHLLLWHVVGPQQVCDETEKKFQRQLVEQRVIQLKCLCKHRSPLCESRGCFSALRVSAVSSLGVSAFLFYTGLKRSAHSSTLHLPTFQAKATSPLFAACNGGNLMHRVSQQTVLNC